MNCPTVQITVFVDVIAHTLEWFACSSNNHRQQTHQSHDQSPFRPKCLIVIEIRDTCFTISYFWSWELLSLPFLSSWLLWSLCLVFKYLWRSSAGLSVFYHWSTKSSCWNSLTNSTAYTPLLLYRRPFSFVYRVLDKQGATWSIALDTKAFDKVWHQVFSRVTWDEPMTWLVRFEHNCWELF